MFERELVGALAQPDAYAGQIGRRTPRGAVIQQAVVQRARIGRHGARLILVGIGMWEIGEVVGHHVFLPGFDTGNWARDLADVEDAQAEVSSSAVGARASRSNVNARRRRVLIVAGGVSRSSPISVASMPA
jgi:hypothetical protein